MVVGLLLEDNTTAIQQPINHGDLIFKIIFNVKWNYDSHKGMEEAQS